MLEDTLIAQLRELDEWMCAVDAQLTQDLDSANHRLAQVRAELAAATGEPRPELHRRAERLESELLILKASAAHAATTRALQALASAKLRHGRLA